MKCSSTRCVKYDSLRSRVIAFMLNGRGIRVQNEILDFVRALKLGSHSIFFYASPREKHEVLFAFLQDGLEKGRGAIYITGQETPTQIRKNMEGFGIDVKTLEREGTLRIINYNQWYIIDGKFDALRILASGKRVFDEAIERGLKGLNVCGETSCFFEKKKVSDLVQYELRCGKKLGVEVTGMCAYDTNLIKSLDANLFLGLMKAHSFTITPRAASQIKFENLYLNTVEEKLNNLLGSSAVQAMLWHLERQHLIKKEKIGENPEAFMTALENLFGPGAELLEKAILEGLFSKIGL